MTLKIIILENALTTWNHPQTRSIINSIVELKAEGYSRAFDDPLLVIPLDVFEFVGTHVLLYKDDQLVMGYKNVFYHDCLRMNLDFPLHNAVKSGGGDEHREAYLKFFKEYGGKRICYDSHLTVSNRAAKDPELLYQCLSILYALVYHYRHTYEVDYSFMLGTYFAGTHKTFLKMGAKVFGGLGPINLSFYDKRDALIMFCDKSFSPKATGLALEYQELWNNRTVINASSYEKLKVA
jgi:hypothetical protein